MRKFRSCLPVLLSLIAALAGTAAAQDFPPSLAEVLPSSVQKLNSNDASERASVLNDLVYRVPMSCTLELGLTHQLPRDAYVFVVRQVLEKDLHGLDTKAKSNTWTFLPHLITRFEMNEFAPAIAEYLTPPGPEVPANEFVRYINNPEVGVNWSVLQTLRGLRAVGMDDKIAQYLSGGLPSQRHQALEILLEFRSKKAVPTLVAKLSDENANDDFWALDKLAEIGAVEAAAAIAEELKDDHPNTSYWALDALVRLDAKPQAEAVWQFLKGSADPRLQGYAIAALVQFEQKAAIPLVVASMKAAAAGSDDYHAVEFVRKLKPQAMLPELMSLYHVKTPLLSDEAADKKLRWQILQLLYEYRSPLAVPIYRENLVDRSGSWPKANAWVASLLQEMNAVEAYDDVLTAFVELAKLPGSENDHNAGQFGLVLAKFGDRKAWKPLIDYLEKSNDFNREQIVIQLNRYVDPKLWNDMNTRKPSQQLGPVKAVVETLSRESGIPIVMPEVPRADTCPTEATDDRTVIPCTYARPDESLHNALLVVVQMLNSQTRAEYTFLYDKGVVRIMKTKDAVEFWKTNILRKLG